MNPLILVENEWLDQSIRHWIEATDRPVHVLTDFPALQQTLSELSADRASGRPMIVLDPGIPGVCCLETVRRTRALDPRAVIVVWTSIRDRAFLSKALLDGAAAASSKHRPPQVLQMAISRTEVGHFACEPEQAQWFIDFLAYLGRCRDRWLNDEGPHTWTDQQLAQFDGVDTEWILHLREIAAGGPLSDDDRWFADVLDFVRSWWLERHLRQALVALAVKGSRSAAAYALGKNPRTFDGYCSRLVTRLLPSRYLTDESDAKGLALAEWVIRNHAGCELPDSEHDLSSVR